MIEKAQIYANTGRHVLRTQYRNSDIGVPLLQRDIGTVSEYRFDRILSEYDDDVVFAHVGLGDVKSAFRTDPYEFLMGKLNEHFDSILTPGFTPSFRSSGIYHKQFSKPAYGTFYRLFLHDATDRTDDAIHSILIDGDYRFDGCDHHDSFGEDGCWAQLDAENVLYLNVGTPSIVSTQHHYIEHLADVPYNKRTKHDGVIYYDESKHREITQYNYEYTVPARRSDTKIQRYLEGEGVLQHYDLEGLNVSLFRARDLRKALMQKLNADPYYMIT